MVCIASLQRQACSLSLAAGFEDYKDGNSPAIEATNFCTSSCVGIPAVFTKLEASIVTSANCSYNFARVSISLGSSLEYVWTNSSPSCGIKRPFQQIARGLE